MAANRFDQAAEMPIINTYVPIDFNNLYRIGATQRQAVQEATAALDSALTRFGEFRSPSAIDIENYYNMTIGRMQPLIEEMAADPDRIKDSGFRARLQSQLNSIDYAGLSKLKEGADALRRREQNVANMIANNTYYENWDRYRDLSNYNTLKQGILDELAPISYRSMFELAAPYVNNMKPTFFQGESPNSGIRMPYTNWMAITPEMRAKELNTHLSDIIATPQGSMHLQEIYQAFPGISQQEALDVFMDQLMTVTSYKDIETPVADEYGMRLALSRASGSGNATPGVITSRTDEIKAQAANQIISKTSQLSKILADSGLISTNNPANMTEEDTALVTAYMIDGFKKNGVTPDYMISISPKEYLQYHNSNTSLLTDKDGNTPDNWKDGAIVENYGYRNGDKVFTDEGREMITIPMSFITSDERDTENIDINRILRNIPQDQAGFQVSEGSNSFMYNDGEEIDVANNTVKTLGTLYVTEQALKEAIKRTYPKLDEGLIGNVGDLLDILEDGFEQNGITHHKIMSESKNKRINGEDTYAIRNVARNIADQGSQNTNFNFDIAKDRTTGTVVSENYGTLLGSSFQ